MASSWTDFKLKVYLKEDILVTLFIPLMEGLLCRLEYAAKNVLGIRERLETTNSQY